MKTCLWIIVALAFAVASAEAGSRKVKTMGKGQVKLERVRLESKCKLTSLAGPTKWGG